MTDILARIIVRETHGLRRFLYPLTVNLSLPGDIFPAKMFVVAVQEQDGTPVPSYLTHANGADDIPQRLDFAVSLAPFETRELLLTLGQEPLLVPDPLNFSLTDGGFRSVQSRFALTVGWDGMLRDVVYDTVPHLRGPLAVTRNGSTLQEVSTSGNLFGEELLAAWHEAEDEANTARTRWELTACKSWATVTHTVQQPKVGDIITFTLPLTVTALPLLCDFGIGGGIYGKLGGDDTVTWETQFGEKGPVQWTLSTNRRTDYAGTVSSWEQYHAQQWFHVIDKGKALAVALTHVPGSCRQCTVTLNSAGDVQIAFTLGDSGDEHAEFGVCYHFLNDAPAIAAATNPQSILLPPTVTVLPA